MMHTFPNQVFYPNATWFAAHKRETLNGNYFPTWEFLLSFSSNKSCTGLMLLDSNFFYLSFTAQHLFLSQFLSAFHIPNLDDEIDRLGVIDGMEDDGYDHSALDYLLN
jgi:hypothetical protein